MDFALSTKAFLLLDNLQVPNMKNVPIIAELINEFAILLRSSPTNTSLGSLHFPAMPFNRRKSANGVGGTYRSIHSILSPATRQFLNGRWSKPQLTVKRFQPKLLSGSQLALYPIEYHLTEVFWRNSVISSYTQMRALRVEAFSNSNATFFFLPSWIQHAGANRRYSMSCI